MLGSALGGIGGAIGYYTSGGGGEDEFKKALQVWKQLQLPDFDMRELMPEDLQLLQEYFPESYEAVVPQQVALPEDSPEVRAEQALALGQVSRTAREGLPLSERLAAEDAQRQLATGARQGQEALLSELGQRGRLGGGTEAVVRATAGQQASNLARDQGNDLARQAVENRYRAALAAGGMAGQLRGQDFGQASERAASVNRFNELVSQLQNQAARENFGQRIAGQEYNLGTRQRLGEQNVMNRYGGRLSSLERQNQLRQGLFGAQVTRAGGMSSAYQQLGNWRDLERQNRINAAQNIGQGVGGIADIGLLGGI